MTAPNAIAISISSEYASHDSKPSIPHSTQVSCNANDSLDSTSEHQENGQGDNEAINRHYDQFTQTFNSLDIKSIDELYGDNAVYISETQHKGIVQGKAAIIALYQSFFEKIRHKNARIEVDFRVTIRQMTDNSATDIGYYLVRFHPQVDTGEPVSEFAGKFVNVFVKDKGQWQISVDSNTRAEARFYFAAKQVTSLYYGQRFITPKSPSKPNK